MKKILFLANRDFVLYNFRFELIKALIQGENKVYICLPYGPKVDEMEQAGAKFIPITVNGRGKNPLDDLRLLSEIKNAIRLAQPDIILTYTTKVCIWGGIASDQMHVPYIVNVSGLGTAVEQKSAIEKLVISLYKRAVKNAQCVFFQNNGNLMFFQNQHIPMRKTRLIPGSGVNLDRWKYLPYPGEENGIHFLFIARIIREKGIEQYLETAKVIRQRHPETVFHILGPCDGEYQDAISKYCADGTVKYHGMIQDTSVFLRIAHCTIHPSFYPEGISNVCLESASSGRPVITTDREGCRETVEDGVTGYIVRQKNTEELIDAVEKFLSLSNREREAMGKSARRYVEERFNRHIVTNAYLEEMGIPRKESSLYDDRLQEDCKEQRSAS